MPASLLTLPYELREQILLPIVKVEGTIQLQYPIWADNMKSVFVPPIAQVCKDLREEVFQFFYRTNVFVWKIDPEVRDWGAGVCWWAFAHYDFIFSCNVVFKDNMNLISLLDRDLTFGVD